MDESPLAAACIRHRPRLTCYLCGAQGRTLYRALPDVLFGAPGEWNFSACPDLDCGLVWLNPVPLEEDIGGAYAQYYTHPCRPAGRNGTSAVLSRFGLMWAYDLLLRLLLVQRERNRLDLMYLQPAKPARLLEVGCGSGDRLALFRTLGWTVSAVEPDAAAAAYAQTVNHLDVRRGSLEQARFPEDSFDAVIMNHVIEHVYDPLGLLKECRRVLKPAGVLLSITPNVHSLGHRLFGRAWRGLEPPRHIFLFSGRTLQKLVAMAGFGAFETWTTSGHAETIIGGSVDVVRAQRRRPQTESDGQSSSHPLVGLLGRLPRSLVMAGWQLAMAVLNPVNRSSGEECVLRAVK
jgi:SAM-dependent methyltransferase